MIPVNPGHVQAMPMKSKTPLIVAAVVIAAVAIGTFVARRSADSTSDAPAATQGPAEAAPAATTSGTRAGGTGSGARAIDTRTRLQETVARRQQSRQDQIKRSAEQREKAIDAFQREKVDPAWASKKEGELNKIAAQPVFETAGAVPKEMRVDCKSSMCRLDGSFATNGQAEDWVLLYMSSVGSAMPNSLVTRKANPDGTTSVEIYGRAR